MNKGNILGRFTGSKILKSNQAILFLVLLGSVIIFGIKNPAIISVASFFSLTRACIIPAVFTLALMLVMIQGGIDISFAAIGAFASYTSVFIFTKMGMMDVSLWLIFLVAIMISVLFQLINWFLITYIKIQSFVTTLAMETMLKGALLAFVSTSYIYTLPDKAAAFSTTYLARAKFPDGNESVLHSSVLIVVIMYIAIHIMLEHTRIGRSIYAIGDGEDAAERAGINVARVRFYVFVLAGIICGIAGVLHDCLARMSRPMPADTVGQELTNIAAVVLGIGITKKASGSVIGTLLGVIFLRFVGTNLIMLGIPSYWQKVVSGLIIFFGIIVQMSKKSGIKGIS
jgi:simple sugar transport system permease protein